MFRHLLVPTDGSDLADGTIRRAVSFAADAGARSGRLIAASWRRLPHHSSRSTPPVRSRRCWSSAA